ncbi:MAG: hypothetical protein JSS75_05090 [Bacteroidetes bacterium]|nr:hypothetical protein [Bacteroidota bacterium]
MDTLRIVGYYGAYARTAIVLCHAIVRPEIGLYGWTSTTIDFGCGSSIYDLNQQIRTDTLHDEMNGGFPIAIATTPQHHGVNENVEVRSCGGETIDSIYTVGDFSEFEFTELSKAPITIADGDSLVIRYLFTPHVVGKLPHSLIFHTIDGKYLVWSLECKVYGTDAVEAIGRAVADDLSLIPNPPTGPCRYECRLLRTTGLTSRS